MSNADEEDEDKAGAAVGSSRYPVMPSLVALQQMKNRLHLALLGKKLMKWTAMATARELRKIAADLMVTYERFEADVGNAFMTLARTRYFYPTVNKMVIENFPSKASVYVKTSYRSSSGVKILQLEIVETEFASYEHLGIGKGGTAVSQAKKEWLELLRRMVQILQYRIGFIDVEIANKNATKKKNVLEKVIVPKITRSIRYILSELEEKEREETFRLKRFKQLKTKRNALKDADKKKKTGPPKEIQVLEPCVPEVPIIYEEPEPIIEEVELEFVLELEPEPEPEPKPEPIPKPVIKPSAPKPIPEKMESIDVCCSCLSAYEADENAPSPICPVCKKAAKVRSKTSKTQINLRPCESSIYKKRLEDLSTHIEEVINLTKQYKMEGIITPSIEKFIQTCNNTKEKIEDYAKTASTCTSYFKPPQTSRTASATSSATASAAASQKSVRSEVPDRPTEVPTLKALPTSDSAASAFKPASAIGSQKSIKSSSEPDKPTEASMNPEELGYFESQYKEVIKVTRIQNDDGTIAEERQVITVKTEKKNPRKRHAPDGSYEQERFIGSCACQSYNIGQTIDKKNIDITESIDSEFIGHHGDEGLKERPSRSKCPRETKSEYLPRCPAMVDPKLRACVSAGSEKPMGGDVWKTCSITISSKQIPLKTDSGAKKSKCCKASAATSTDNAICSMSKTNSVCSQKKKQPCQTSIGAEKKTNDSQKKVTVDKSTYCMPNCCDTKFNTVSCGAGRRDVSTSTIDLRICSICTAKPSTESIKNKKKKNKMNSDSYCKIKIVIKPQHGKDETKKCKEEALSGTSSIIDVFTKFLSCNQNDDTHRDWSEIEKVCIKCFKKLSTKPSKCTVCREPPEDALEIDGPCHSCAAKQDKTEPKQNISGKCKKCQHDLEEAIHKNELCQRCLTQLSNTLNEKSSEKMCITCKACKDKLEELTKNDLCASCIAKIDDIAPCKMPLSKSSTVKYVEDNEKGNTCSCAKPSHEYCTSVGVDTNSCDCYRSPIAVPCKSPKIWCDRVVKKASKVSTRSACCGSCSERHTYEDAGTITKRCNRFDVRPIRRRHTCEVSAPRPRARIPKKSKSFHEKDCYYYKNSKK